MAETDLGPAVTFSVRRTEDIALDLMRFVAVTTGYGKNASAVGFSGKPGTPTPEEYADALLHLYQRCHEVLQGKKMADPAGAPPARGVQ